MADNEATRDLFRELLGMIDGGTTGGRGPMHIPTDIMDSLAGDAAQDSLARESLIMEMRKTEARANDPRFVSLDLMEMEADDVDDFLKTARKKIIKRSKATRKACCSRIGGVLDQMMGPAGDEYLDGVEADDRGKHDPIGGADDAKTYRMVKESYLSEMGVQGLAKRGELGSGPLAYHEKPRTWSTGRAKMKSGEAPAKHPVTVMPRTGPGDSPRGAWKAFSSEERRRGRDPVQSLEKDERESGRTRQVPYLKGVSLGDEDKTGWRAREKTADSIDVDLFSFIAEEFFHWEHDQNCAFADPNFSLFERGPLGEAEKFIQKAIKKPGALRAHYGAGEGDEIPMAKARADYKRLSKKAEGEGTLTGDEMKLFKRLQLFLKVLKPASQQEDHYEDYPMEPSKTALALSSFMESSHNAYAAAHSGSGKGSPGSLLRKQDYAGDMSRAECDDNKDYPTDLMPAKSGGNRTAGAPGKLSTRDKDAGDPIGEAVAAPAPAFGQPDDEGPSGVIPGPRKKGMPGKPKMPSAGGSNRVSRIMNQGDSTNRVSGRSGDNYPSAGALNRMFKASGQRPDMQDVDYDGPVISETAMALANFMEASSQAADAKSKLALGKGDAGDLSLAKRNDTRENLGGPLQKFGSMRGSLDVYDDGGKKARFDKGANPIGGAVPGEQSAKRMKK